MNNDEKPFATFDEHSSEINDATFSEDSQFCITASSELLVFREIHRTGSGAYDIEVIKKVDSSSFKVKDLSFKLIR